MRIVAALTSRFPAGSWISTSLKTTGENQPSDALAEVIVPLSPGRAIASGRLRSGVKARPIGSTHINSV